MSEELKVFKKRVGDIGIIALVGDVTSLSEELINTGYEGFTQEGMKIILLDFALVNYINSSGIAILIGIINKAKQKGQVINIAGLTPHFQKIFKMVGLTRLIKMYDSVSSALDSKGVDADVRVTV